MTLQNAFALFRHLGVNVESMTRVEFRAAYIRLARRYHPDVNPSARELMTNMNQARQMIIQSRPPAERAP
jgi:curved DNA-binding protein CbpA